jgi:hypothetical protein
MTTKAWVQKHVDFALTRDNDDCIGILESIAVRLAISPLEKDAPETKVEQTKCETCYYMVHEVDPMPCNQCLTIRSLWRAADDDKPCSHPGCRSHVTYPCEVCGRQWGV